MSDIHDPWLDYYGTHSEGCGCLICRMHDKPLPFEFTRGHVIEAIAKLRENVRRLEANRQELVRQQQEAHEALRSVLMEVAEYPYALPRASRRELYAAYRDCKRDCQEQEQKIDREIATVDSALRSSRAAIDDFVDRLVPAEGAPQ